MRNQLTLVFLVDINGMNSYQLYFGLSPLPVTVTTRIITFLVGDPNLNLHLPQLLGGGTTQVILGIISFQP